MFYKKITNDIKKSVNKTTMMKEKNSEEKNKVLFNKVTIWGMKKIARCTKFIYCFMSLTHRRIELIKHEVMIKFPHKKTIKRYIWHLRYQTWIEGTIVGLISPIRKIEGKYERLWHQNDQIPVMLHLE